MDGLVINGTVFDVRPLGLLHGQPVVVGLEPPLEQPLGLLLLLRNQPDDPLVQPRGDSFLLDSGIEAVFVLALG